MIFPNVSFFIKLLSIGLTLKTEAYFMTTEKETENIVPLSL